MRRMVVVLCAAVAAVLVWGVDHHARNFHTVERGVLYRSGQPTPTGLRLAIRAYGIRTVVTLRTVRDPDRPYPDEWEAGVCAAHGVRHVRIVPRPWSVNERGERPADEAVKAFLAVMDDPTNHPVLVHCFAGVHRTGTLCAVYRREYQGWSAGRAIAEMESYGFGVSQGREAIDDYLRTYQPHRTP